ncbi:hypothetical protein F2Q70_00026436 [Brassica cretica]|uniref:Uncharacterized protein n=1 Tax=Brassica cretica TaxID=69181 RepID=A0A8S9LAE7_BRACR|nr:hypothetical protein F2Q70_00026436 [Brassica cretica]
MGCEELKPIASMRAPDGGFEDPEIAEQLRRSRDQPVIRRDRCIREEDTLKTLERATPILRPCFHPSLDLFS